MGKIQASYYSKNERQKECKNDLNNFKIDNREKNHPLKLEREYVKALNETKIDKFMAKPFISAFNFHREGITSLVKDYSSSAFISSSFDNEIVVYDFFSKNYTKILKYDQIVRAVGIDDSRIFISQNKDLVYENVHNKTGNVSNEEGKDVKEGKVNYKNDKNYLRNNFQIKNTNIFKTKTNNIKSFLKTEDLILSIDVYQNKLAVGCYNSFLFVDPEYGEVLNKYKLPGRNNLIKFNKTFENILAVGNDSNLLLHDVRMGKEIYHFDESFGCVDFYENNLGFVSSNISRSSLNENKIVITDMRKLYDTFYNKKIINKHTNKINCINFSPDGKKLASGSSDSTIRIENLYKNTSMVYYSERMGIVNGISYSNCNNYLVSGSDDGSARLWKAEINNSNKMQSYKEKLHRVEGKMLKSKFKNYNEIRRIKNHLFLPTKLKHDIRQKNEMYQADIRREFNKKRD